ncbi:general transcription factor IIE subunit 1-like [Gigantopelta aegis]|uniref:general transcription factor IIE subunit 1-like n=1 Tax=Gigantopelta aegis TaxID=1735272 RepID=UPI001B88A826|nr:general transcription factor IIE subunit 1-like [Gigantopelta aegis]XP_041353568.1 general transcription factor IIE subunit 1-like [Gigantopelta aegis]
MDTEVLTEVPESLTRLARLIVRGFYSPETAIVIDMLVRNPCIKEEDMIELLKFERKQLRSIINSLKADKILKARMRVETDAEGKCTRHNYYFINYNVFVNIVKYKLDHMRRKIEMEERDNTSRASFKCSNPQCQKTFTDLEVGQMIDPMTGLLRCTICEQAVEEDESSLPSQDARTLMAKFNEQIQPIYDLLRNCEDIKLAPEILEPEPMDLSKILQPRGQGGKLSDQDPGKMTWSGEASRKTAFGYSENQLTVTVGEDNGITAPVKKRAAPDWMTNSTVDGASNDLQIIVDEPTFEVGASRVDATEVMNTLLVHEKKATRALIPGAGSDESSSSSEDESSIKPAVISGNIDEMESEEEDSVPMVMIGDRKVPYPEITDDIVEQMTPDEKEEYIRIGQEWYQHMYE